MFEGRVLVTGAAGFLGQTVCATLADNGVVVRAMTRSKPTGVARCESVIADLTDAGSLRQAVAGVDAVVHLAARVHVMRERASDPLTAFRRVNVQGTAELLDAASSAGVRRLIFISSVKAVTDQSTVPLTSASVCSPSDDYGTTKFEAESIVRRMGKVGPLQTSTLRLPLVYGPGMRGNMLRLFDCVHYGLPLPFGRINNARSIVYSGNVAAAILHILQMSTLPAGPFFVSDLGDLSTPELIKVIARSLGKRPRLFPVPERVLKVATNAVSYARIVGLPDVAPALDRLMSSLRVSSEELREQTGFIQPCSTTDGMRHTANWYLARARVAMT